MPTRTVCARALRFKETELASGADSSFFSTVSFFLSPFPFLRVEEIVISFRHHCHWWFPNPQRLHRLFFTRASRRFCGTPLRASSSCSFENRGVPVPAAGVEVFPLVFFSAGPSFFSCASEACPCPRLRFPFPCSAPELLLPIAVPALFSSRWCCSRTSPTSLIATTNSSSSLGIPPRIFTRSSRNSVDKPRWRVFHQWIPWTPTFSFKLSS